MPEQSPEPDAGEDEQKPPAITARAITMHGPWGPVYGPVDLDIDEGGVTVLVAPAGTGRTALLMTLAGRMKTARRTADGVRAHPRPRYLPLRGPGRDR